MSTQVAPKKFKAKNRKEVLLKAAYDLLKKCSESYYVLSVNEVEVFYDDAECDGHCLIGDIAIELGLGE